MTGSKAWIAGVAGLSLSADERAFFADEHPWGFILFGRNIESAAQVSDLVASLKEAGGRISTPVFVDQEGGRVQRLRPPLAPRYPPAATLGAIYDADPAAGERAAPGLDRAVAGGSGTATEAEDGRSVAAASRQSSSCQR